MSHGNQRHQRCDFSRGAAGWAPPLSAPNRRGMGSRGMPRTTPAASSVPPCRADLGVSWRLWGG